MFDKRKLVTIGERFRKDPEQLMTMLHAAVENNDLKGLKLIFNNNLLDILSITPQKLFAITLQFFRSDEYCRITEWIVRQLTPEQRQDFCDQNNVTAMHEAAIYGARKTVAILISV